MVAWSGQHDGRNHLISEGRSRSRPGAGPRSNPQISISANEALEAPRSGQSFRQRLLRGRLPLPSTRRRPLAPPGPAAWLWSPGRSRGYETWRFAWDAEDRLVSVVTSDGTVWR
ncbi:hypothetical protein [Streptomyces sp. NBC_01363]|uniref:hypothetical protein n=1 Tax=Streptomyces sp. NBC_01363 TaxID=2903840 RepID=UPI00338E1114